MWLCGHVPAPPLQSIAWHHLSVAVWMVFLCDSEGPECEPIACAVPGRVPATNVELALHKMLDRMQSSMNLIAQHGLWQPWVKSWFCVE